MAKSPKSKLVKRFKRRRARATSERAAPRKNPPMLQDLAELALPGFGAFATTRLATRAAQTQIEQRFPGWGKHAGAAASVGSFLAAWLLAHRWKPLEKYHTPIVMGSAIAAIQSLMQIYFPKLGWIVSDATPDMAPAQASTPGNQITATSGSQDDFEVLDDNSWYAYNDAHDAGPTYQRAQKQNAQRQPAQNPAREAAQPSAEDDSIFDVLEDEEMQAQGWSAGLAQN